MKIINKSKKNKKRTIKNRTIKRKTIKNPPFPIDIVYTWKGEEMSNNNRLAYNYELKYSLRSIYLFAPWVNKIYILMNKYKQPSWIKDNNKIIIVEHSETFPSNKYLPNTNSNAIETTIANIKGLSNHFIYLNDDFFLGKKVKYTDFFTPDGKALVDKRTLQLRSVVKNNSKKKLDFEIPDNFEKLYKHIPISLIKDEVLNFNIKYADYIDWIRNTKKRIDKGYNICEKNKLNSPCQQIHYPIAQFMYTNNKAKIANDKKYKSYYVPSIDPNFQKKLNTILNIKPKFFCINDVETNPEKRKIVTDEMLSFFNKYYPDKPAYEK